MADFFSEEQKITRLKEWFKEIDQPLQENELEKAIKKYPQIPMLDLLWEQYSVLKGTKNPKATLDKFYKKYQKKKAMSKSEKRNCCILGFTVILLGFCVGAVISLLFH
jgi:hypothetical protein